MAAPPSPIIAAITGLMPPAIIMGAAPEPVRPIGTPGADCRGAVTDSGVRPRATAVLYALRRIAASATLMPGLRAMMSLRVMGLGLEESPASSLPFLSGLAERLRDLLR